MPDRKDAADHSPIPWRVHDDGATRLTVCSPWTATHRAGDSSGYGDYRGIHVAVIDHQGDNPCVSKATALANASFIVRAVNNHEALLAALKMLVYDGEHMQDCGAQRWCDSGPLPPDESQCSCGAVKARAAIAAAEGTTP